jgi:hypothetical protein
MFGYRLSRFHFRLFSLRISRISSSPRNLLTRRGAAALRELHESLQHALADDELERR